MGYSPTAEHIQVFIFYTISTFVIAYFIFVLSKSLCCSKGDEESQPAYDNEKKGDKLIFWTSFIAICFFEMRSVIVWFSFLLILATGYDNQDNNIPLDLSFFGYGLALWAMLLIFVFRIDYGFRDSFLAYSPVVIKVLYGIVGLMLFLTLLVSVFVALDELGIVGGAMGPAILGLHFIFSVILIYLLFKKIFFLMQTKIDQSDNKNDEDKTSNTEDIIHLDNINSFTRYSLLIFIGLISTYISIVMVAVFLQFDEEHVVRDAGLGYSFIAFDLCVNSIVLFLLFPLNTAMYYKICNCCHQCCQKCCIQCVYMNMKNNTDKDKQQFVELILS